MTNNKDIIMTDTNNTHLDSKIAPDLTPDTKVVTSGIYTHDEQQALEKTKAIRMLVVDDMTKQGTVAPTAVGELRVLNEYLNGLDDSIIRTAETRIKQEAAVNQDSVRDMVAEMLIQIASERKNKVIKPKSTSIDIGIDAIPTNTVAGEMDIEAEPLTLAQFIKE